MRFIKSGRVMHLRRTCLGLVFISLILMGVPMTALIHSVLAAPITVLTPKWSRSNLGTGYEGGLVIGDVTGDGSEDIVYAGGGSDRINVLDGDDGSTIATYTNTRINQYCQPQLYDVDNDGIFEILVPLYYRPGLAVVKYDGDSTLSELWVRDVQGTSGSGSVMSKPVAGDINGDGYLEIFQASQDVGPAGGYDGTVVKFDRLGNILAQTFSWRSCSGGLSLGDTDNDGVFELYMGDRQMGYTDGGYGKGARSFWADNLTERWNRLDFLSSSQAPVLADVNGDGILDVITGMYSEMNILNSTNGAMIQRWSDSRTRMSVHYGFTVYDIDGDGHLELLCSDGDHDDDPYADVYDLVTGNLDAQLSLAGGDWKWGPLVADISPSSPGMEIIMAPNGTDLEPNYWNGAIMIYSSSYESLQNVTRTINNARLSSQLGYPFVQDIDGDDLLELVVCSSSGYVYAFDTSGPAPGGSERIRSEVTYYGEARLGVAEHTIMPWEEDYWTAPLVAPVSPGDNSLAVPVSTSQLSFRMREHQGQSVSYTVTTSPNIGGSSGSSIGNPYNWRPYTVNLGSLDYDTTYKWTVSATDGVNSIVRTYSFRTEHAPIGGNHPPTQSTPSLVSQDGLDTTTSTFNCSSRSTADLDGDPVTNIYRWQVNGNSVANLLLPFDTRNETMTKDYSGFGNNGIVKGAVWTANGKVGGAYSFDGKDDAIIVSDGGAGYFDNKTYGNYNPELGGNGRWNEITVEAWIYLTAYNNGSRIVAKIPSYALGFQSGSTNRLYASVWPAMGQIADDENAASTDREQTVSYTVSTLQLNTWYQIAFTYKNGTGLKLYLNGALVASGTTNKGPIKSSLGEPLYIGRLVQPFKGSIDEVRIYPYAQPPEQILNRYQESKDGLSNSSLFYPLGIAVPGNTLRCQVIPTDSYEEGGSATSASVTLLNTPPVAANLVILPSRDRAFRLDGENLGAGYVYSDADGSPETGSQIRWYRNGVPQTAFNDLKQVPAASTSIGQKWYFTVTPRDSGGALGDLQTSENVTIRGNSPPNTGTPTLDSMNGGTDYDDEDLAATAATTTDGDSDATTNIFHWIKGGVSQTSLQMPFDTEIPLVPGTNGIASDYSGYGNNGAVNGSTWVQDGVVGGALSFDGNDYVTVQESSNTLGGDGSWSTISVEFWVRATGATTSTQTVLFKPNNLYSPGASSYGVGYRIQYRYYADSYRVYWIVSNNTAQRSLNSRVYEGPSQWHHVICTYQSGAGLKIYTDGTLRASMAGTGNINATSGGFLYVGGINTGQGDFIGQMDEVRIYPKVLSAAQIFQRYIETKDGLNASNTIVAQETTAGEDWVCQVIPNDSWADGAAKNSPTLHVTVSVNSRPRIDWYSPVDLTPEVDEGSSLIFGQVSSDPDGPFPLGYTWKLDSIVQANTQNWTYSTGDMSAGLHAVTLTVSDGSLSDTQEWQVTVNDVGGLQYELIIQAGAGGTTDPVPGTYMEDEGLGVPVEAIPDANMKLDHWLLDNIDVGNTNPYTVTMNTNHNLTAVFTASSADAYLTVRGGDDRIYYRIYNSTSNSWENWRVTPLGATCDSPAAAIYSGKLYFVVRGMGGQSLWFGSVNITDYSFSGWTGLSGATPSAPILTVYGSKLILVVRGFDNTLYYRYYDAILETWGGWIAMAIGATCDSPAATVLGNSLHLVVRGFSATDVLGNNTLWHGIVNLADDSFSGWTSLPGATASAPTLTASATFNTLYLSVRGLDDLIFINEWSSSVWQGWTALPTGATSDSPALTVANDTLVIVVRGMDGNSLWHCYVDLNTHIQSGWTLISGSTISAPTLSS